MRTLGIFALLGALLFAIDRASEHAARSAGAPTREAAAAQERGPTPEGDVRLLAAPARRAGLDRRDPVVRARLVRNLRFLGHDGSDAALYREALALGMDRSDVVIERRLADRMAAHLRADALREPSNDAELRQWYERNGERWRRAPAVAFTHVFVSHERHGAAAEMHARTLRAALRAERIDPKDAPARGDPFLLAAHAPLRRAPDLARQFGPAFAAAVLALRPGGWSDPIESSFGLHLVWVHERRGETRPPFEEVRAQVSDAWREARGDGGLRNALVSLRAGSKPGSISLPECPESEVRRRIFETALSTSLCTEIASAGRSQGARPRHSRCYGEGAQRGERPADAVECRRTSDSGH